MPKEKWEKAKFVGFPNPYEKIDKIIKLLEDINKNLEFLCQKKN